MASSLDRAVDSLILGTVQLGLPYGIANTSGQPSLATAQALVRAAVEGGVRYFDTAQAYGVSERVLGEALRSLSEIDNFHIITKLAPSLPTDPSALRRSVESSLTHLGVQHLYCLMLHREEHLSALDDWLGEILNHYVDEGRVESIGVSVYSPEAALAALAHPLVRMVQIPASIFDRRFAQAGVFVRASQLGKELHVRSIFLQGAVCMAPERLPSFLSALKPSAKALHTACATWGWSVPQAVMAWMMRRYPESRLIFGAETVEQVQNNLHCAARAASLPDEFCHVLDAIVPPQTAAVLNPALWGK